MKNSTAIAGQQTGFLFQGKLYKTEKQIWDNKLYSVVMSKEKPLKFPFDIKVNPKITHSPLQLLKAGKKVGVKFTMNCSDMPNMKDVETTIWGDSGLNLKEKLEAFFA